MRLIATQQRNHSPTTQPHPARNACSHIQAYHVNDAYWPLCSISKSTGTPHNPPFAKSFCILAARRQSNLRIVCRMLISHGDLATTTLLTTLPLASQSRGPLELRARLGLRTTAPGRRTHVLEIAVIVAET